jgi:uncharacterized protein YqgC (DUF456 family)
VLHILIKIAAVILIVTGIAGLILPVVPGILLITTGAALLFGESVRKE